MAKKRAQLSQNHFERKKNTNTNETIEMRNDRNKHTEREWGEKKYVLNHEQSMAYNIS